MAQPRHLLVVDDDPAVTSLLRRAFSYEGYAVTVASSGVDALALVQSDVPDLIVLDITMPVLDGLEVCRQLKHEHPELPILMLTARDNPADEIAGLDLGANDYVTKPFDLDVLNARVRALLRQDGTEQPSTLEYAGLSLDTGERIAARDGRAIELTTTEFRLLHLFMLQPRQVLTKDQLLERVWGYDFGGNANVVEVYVSGLRRKLEAAGETRLIQTVRGAGYALRER
jgi:two-component system, OmpR family, response regulator MprA